MSLLLQPTGKVSPALRQKQLKSKERDFESLVGSPNNEPKQLVPNLTRVESEDNLGNAQRRGPIRLTVDTSFKNSTNSLLANTDLKSPNEDGLIFPLSPIGDGTESKNATNAIKPKSEAQTVPFRFKLGSNSLVGLMKTESETTFDPDADDAETPAHRSNSNKTLGLSKKLSSTASLSGLSRTTSGPLLLKEGFTCSACLCALNNCIRFRCLDSKCFNTDLCANCEAKGVHDKNHFLVKVPASASQAKTLPPLVCNRSFWTHEGFSCAVCGTAPILGYRSMCTICDLQLCEACEFLGLHDVSHSRLRYACTGGTV